MNVESRNVFARRAINVLSVESCHPEARLRPQLERVLAADEIQRRDLFSHPFEKIDRYHER